MADPLSIRFDMTPESQARFSAVLRDLQTIARRSSGPLVKRMANMFAVSARKDTPHGKKERIRTLNLTSEDRKRIRSEGGRAPRGATVGHEYWSREVNGRRYIVATYGQNKRNIRTAGAAKGAWSGAIRKIGDKNQIAGSGSIPPQLASVAVTGSRVTVGDSGKSNTWLVLDYLVKYLSKLRPNIMQTAMISMQNRIANTELKRIGEQFRERWARG